jgi:hypothetical protein
MLQRHSQTDELNFPDHCMGFRRQATGLGSLAEGGSMSMSTSIGLKGDRDSNARIRHRLVIHRSACLTPIVTGPFQIKT